MQPNDGREIVVISDLHMSAGRDEDTGTFHRNEDFFYDGAFARFVGHLVDRARSRERSVRLVVLGDFVDFLQVDPGPLYDIRDTSGASTVAKLGKIVRGHASAFEALARFLAEGHALDIVVGNHDIEFAWPEVRNSFRGLLSERAGADVGRGVTFHPWFLLVPGVLYAEHGHQYDARNSFVKQMEPFLPSGDKIELPLGSFFVLDLFNEIEQGDPFADNIKPPTRYVSWALANRPSQGARALLLYRRFRASVMDKTWDRDEDAERKEIERYREEHLRPFAQGVGLPTSVVEGINGAAKIPTVRRKGDQRRELGPEPSTVVALLAGGVAYGALLRRLGSGSRTLVALGTLAGAASLRDWSRSRPTVQSNNYLLGAARRIHELLVGAGADVPAYVFGHTHNAEQFPVLGDGGGPRYLNSGTWMPIVDQPFDLLTTREMFTFVRVTGDAPRRERLMLWNDAAGREEPLTRLALPIRSPR